MFWNPAGLARQEPESPADLSLGYGQLLEGTYAGTAAFSKAAGKLGVFAAGLTYFAQSPQTGYTAQGDVDGSFSPSDTAFAFGYGRRLPRALVGGGVKIVRSSLAEQTGTTAALDFGAQFERVGRIGQGDLDAGVFVSNLGAPMKLGAVTAPLPFKAQGGALWRASPLVDFGLDVHFPVDADPFVSLGVEAHYRQPGWKGAFRLGFDQSRTRGVEGGLIGVSAGAGLDLKRFRVDYAWVPYGDLGMTNRISLAFRF